MKNKFKSISILVYLLIIWGFFSIVKFDISVPTYKIGGFGESFTVKTSSSNYANATVISDGFGGVYWNDGGSYGPSIAMDNSGNVHVVWVDGTDGPWGTDLEIMYVNYSSSAGWSNVTVISDGFGGVYWNDGSSYDPSIAIDNSGNVHVVWDDTTAGPWGTDREIMYVNYSSSAGWSNATVISDGFGGVYWNDGVSECPSIAIDNSGNVHVVWHDTTNGPWGTDYEIMYVNYYSSAGWSNATVISDGFEGVYWNDGFSELPSIAIDNGGNVHVVWDDDTAGPWGTDNKIMYVKYSSSAGWSNATVISDGFGGVYWNDGGSYESSIAVDNGGNVHVVWEDYTAGPWGTDPEIMYTFIDDVVPTIIINSPTPNEFIGSGAPNYNISIVESFLNTTWYTLDGGITNIIFSGLTGTINQTEWDKKGDGTVTIRFSGNDTLGNEGYAEVTVRKDTIAPTSSISYIVHKEPNMVNKSTTFTLTANDGSGSGVSVIRYKINDSDWFEYSTPLNLSQYTYGDILISYQAIDEIGNFEEENTLLVELVDTGPSDNVIMILIIVGSIVGVVGVGIAIFVLRKRRRAITGE